MKGVSRAVVVLLVLAGGGGVSAEVIDRVVAVLSGQIVTKSDVDAAVALGLASSLQDLIDRTMMLIEVRRVTPADPAPAAVDARMGRIRGRFASPEALAVALSAGGIDEAAMRAYAADDLVLEVYLDERFSSAAQPTDDEIQQVRSERPDTTVEQARARVFSERRQALIGAWVAELRRRADILVLGQ